MSDIDYEPEFEGSYDPRKADTPEMPPIAIPKEALSADALRGVIDNFVMREGTDYGTAEVSYESKIERVMKQMEKGDIKIVFDPNSETVTLMTKSEFKKLGLESPEES
jgi:uncharacterized protein